MNDTAAPTHSAIRNTGEPAAAGSPKTNRRSTAGRHPQPPCPVQAWFTASGDPTGAYHVVPRVLMQSMPPAWQRRMVACLTELDDACGHLVQPAGYIVQPAEAVVISELDDRQLAAAGYSREWIDQAATNVSADVARADPQDGRFIYLDRTGAEIDEWEQVLIPTRDPLPHHTSGRPLLTTARRST